MNSNLNGKPNPHDAKEWMTRANKYLDEEHKISLWAVSQRCGKQYSYVSAVLNGWHQPSDYVEDKLRTVIEHCKKVVREQERAKAQNKKE